MNMTTDAPPKVKYPRADALAVAKVLCDALRPGTEKLICAGSLRRGKAMVGDVEILYVPKLAPLKEVRQGDLLGGEFAQPIKLTNLADLAINSLLARCILQQRLNSLGSIMWGEKNKLARHVASGIPVDLFAATESNWWNILVCRTGGKDNNVAICNAAIAKGWKWNPYGVGFTDEHGQVVPVASEEEVFRLVGLPYLQPWERA